MKIDEREKIMKSLQGVSGITDVLRNSAVNTAFFRPGKSKKSVDDIIEEEETIPPHRPGQRDRTTVPFACAQHGSKLVGESRIQRLIVRKQSILLDNR